MDLIEELEAIEMENPGLFMALAEEDKSWIGRDEEARKIMLERRAKRKRSEYLGEDVVGPRA